jgi:hypothetical protein
MKRPLQRGRAIDMRRMRRWTDDFPGYRITITEQRIDRWINQFQRRDRDLAARLLDAVDFITTEQTSGAFRSVLNMLPGWNINEGERTGRWRFVAFSSSAGESGDTMLHRFRLANGMAGRRYNPLFVYRRDLLQEELGPNDSVVFVDDFSGSGNQVCNNWPEIAELLPGAPNIYLALIATTATAQTRIAQETDITVAPQYVLGDGDNIFSDSCTHFTEAEKEIILQYCRRVDRDNPRGFGDCGLLIVFAHNCPNNSIPILHRSAGRWEGLFRRYD